VDRWADKSGSVNRILDPRNPHTRRRPSTKPNRKLDHPISAFTQQIPRDTATARSRPSMSSNWAQAIAGTLVRVAEGFKRWVEPMMQETLAFGSQNTRLRAACDLRLPWPRSQRGAGRHSQFGPLRGSCTARVSPEGGWIRVTPTAIEQS
jgi:hypothetical protein